MKIEKKLEAIALSLEAAWDPFSLDSNPVHPDGRVGQIRHREGHHGRRQLRPEQVRLGEKIGRVCHLGVGHIRTSNLYNSMGESYIYIYILIV